MKTRQWHQETDVVVVGAGLAGYCAALEAAHAGAQVLVLEKQPEIGGSSLLSSGFIAFAGTECQKAAGVADDEARLYADLRRAGGEQNDERLLKVYVEQQLATYRWLNEIGIAFKTVELSAAQSVPRTHPVDPHALLHRIRELGEATGRVTTRPQAAASRLCTDAAGAVTGVIASLDGQAVAICARRGVVLTTGGFSRDEELLRNFAPHQAGGVRYGGEGNTGDGLRMAWQLGAGFCDMGYIKGTFGFHPNAGKEKGRGWTKLPVYRGGIAVNQQGRRFVDESKSYKLLGDAVLQQPGAIAYQIFDADIMDGATDGVSPFDFRSARSRGLTFEADTLAGLATRLDIDPQELVATVDRYNADVTAGKDTAFGRGGLSMQYGSLRRLERPPFYAYPSTSGVIATYCGLTVDAETRVLNVFGERIPRLYAAGEIMGGFHGVAYMTGSALGKCLIFGRIAGRTAAIQ